MKKTTTIVAIFCSLFIWTSCDPQPQDSETVIIKENSTEEPIVVEEDNTNTDQKEEGIDIQLGTDENGEVDVNVEGRIEDDK